MGLTGLLPLLVAPAYFRELNYSDVISVYFSDIQRLFFGGFVLALALEKRKVLEQVLFRIFRGQTKISGVHLALISILITYFLSFWISNTAAALIMVGFVTQSLSRCPQLLTFGLFGIGYAASLGGLATLIGSPPNGIAAQYLNSQHDAQIHFANWIPTKLVPRLPPRPILLNLKKFLESHLPGQNSNFIFGLAGIFFGRNNPFL